MTKGREQGSRRKTAAAAVVVTLLAFVGLAFLGEGLLTSADDIAPVVIRQDGVVVASFTIDELREFPQHTVTQFGKTETGPAVLDVLAAAGVTDFRRLTVTGLAVRDPGRLELDASEVTPDVVLDFANRGTVKVAGPDIPWSSRVRDVTVLEVE